MKIDQTVFSAYDKHTLTKENKKKEDIDHTKYNTIYRI